MRLSRNTQMRVAGRTLVAAVSAAAVAVVGCGESSTHSSPTATSGAQSQSASTSTTSSTSTSPPPTKTSGRSERSVTVAMHVAIPGLLAEHQIPKRYTCDGEDVSLPVEWSGVPPGTAELVLSVMGFQLVNGTQLFFDWAVAGLSPTSHGISAGSLPPGAVVGRNGFGKVGYSICPPKGKNETYIVRLSALTRPIAAQSGFDPNTLLPEAERSAKVIGLGGGSYKRP